MCRTMTLAVLLLSACSGAPACRATEEPCAVAPLRVFGDPSAVDCEAVAADVATSRQHFERERFAVGGFDVAFEGLRVYVHRTVGIHAAEGPRVGRFHAVDGVDVGAHGSALPHELMHALDAQQGHVFTGWHWFWDWEFDDAVTAEMTGAWVPEPLESQDCGVAP